jgi:LCP family protein required for cell wall assembly
VLQIQYLEYLINKAKHPIQEVLFKLVIHTNINSPVSPTSAQNKFSKVPKQNKTSLQYAAFAFCMFLIFVTTYFFFYANDGSGNQQTNLLKSLSFQELKEPMFVLVAGTDQEYTRAKNGYMAKVKNSFHGRTDTIIVAKFDPTNKTLSAINIPRDTRIYVNGRRADKINSINAYGGIENLRKVLESLLEIKIDRYVLVNSAGVEGLIDQAGGVEVDIPKRMVYHDQTDGLNIDFWPGKKVLNGKESVAFLRFRHDSLGDIGRIQRQQAFMRAIKGKLTDPSLLARLPQISSTALESIKTDLNVSEMIQLANFVKNTSSESQIFATLPGDFSTPETETAVVYEEVPVGEATNPEPSTPANPQDPASSDGTENTVLQKRVITCTAPFVSYWVPNEEEIKKLVDHLFKNVQETVDPETDETKLHNKVSVAIENSTSNKTSSRKLSALLHKKKYNIVDISKSFQHDQPSAIYAQKGNIEEAKLLQKELHLESVTKIMAGSVGSPLADIVIVIGPKLSDELEAQSGP